MKTEKKVIGLLIIIIIVLMIIVFKPSKTGEDFSDLSEEEILCRDLKLDIDVDCSKYRLSVSGFDVGNKKTESARIIYYYVDSEGYSHDYEKIVDFKGQFTSSSGANTGSRYTKIAIEPIVKKSGREIICSYKRVFEYC